MKTVPKPRLFDKRIQFVTYGPVDDGFGGTTTAPTPGERRWAFIRKISDVSATDFISRYGLTQNSYLIRATIREKNTNARNEGFLYNGEPYRILVALPNDQYRVSIDLIAVRIENPTT